MMTMRNVRVLLLLTSMSFQGTLAQESTDLIAYSGRYGEDCDDTVYACDGPNNVFLIDPETREQTELGIGLHDPSALAWSADGIRLTYSREGLYSVTLPDTTPERFLNDPTLNYSWSAVSPDGNRIAYLAGEIETLQTRYVYQLMVSPITDTGQPLVIPDLNVWGPPVWSPNSRQILITASEIDDYTPGVGPARQLYRIDAATGRATQLTDDDTFPNGMTWSRDGKQIAFSASIVEEEQRWESRIIVMNADGSERRTIVEGPGIQTPVTPWSEENYILYGSNPDPGQRVGEDTVLHLLHVETGEDRVLGSSRTIGGADWSPDGTQLVYTPGDGVTADVCIVTLTDLSERCLGVTAHWLAEPLWRETVVS